MVQVILTVTKGPGTGRLFAIRRGQLMQVGSTSWADFSVPDDKEMADVHFKVEYDMQGCRVHDLGSVGGTFINGAKVTSSPLHTGDEIGAGQSVFSVVVEGESKRETGDAEVDSPEDTAIPPMSEEVSPSTAADFAKHVELDEDAQALLQGQQPPAKFLDLLIDAELFADAIKFLAIWLPKPDAVAWAGQCLRDVFGDNLTAKEENAMQAAMQWASEPNDENRRAAGAAGEAAGYDRPAGLLGAAAFVSGGSLGAADLEPVPPPEGLIAISIAGALTMTVYEGEPGKADERYRKFLEAGMKIAAQSAGE